jgi:hypothetical protein
MHTAEPRPEITDNMIAEAQWMKDLIDLYEHNYRAPAKAIPVRACDVCGDAIPAGQWEHCEPRPC